MKPYVVAAIFARGGSKGVPRKNLRALAGKPLIAYAIESALGSEMIDRVIVSTDDQEIASVAKGYGAEVPFMRPAELAGDNAPEWLAWQHAIKMVAADKGAPAIDVFVSVPPTAPLRNVSDIDSCIQTLIESDADIVITVKPAERSPFFNMVKVTPEGYAELAIAPPQKISRRQDAPVLYDVTTVAYAARPQFVLEASSLFQGKVKVVIVPAERAIDIDTELDFMFADFLITQRMQPAREAAKAKLD
jgi:N-acylneuraminate cytidylyltransferase